MNKPEVKEEVKAFLGEGTEFNGLLSFEGTVRIDGKFEGEVVSKAEQDARALSAKERKIEKSKVKYI